MQYVIQMMLRVSAVCHMLDTCSHFGKFHSLVFKAVKTQLIRFARCGTTNEAKLSFFGQELELTKSVTDMVTSSLMISLTMKTSSPSRRRSLL